MNQRPDKKSLYQKITILKRINPFNKNNKYMRTKMESVDQNLCFPPISKQVQLHEIIDRTLTSQILQLLIKIYIRNISLIWLGIVQVLDYQ